MKFRISGRARAKIRRADEWWRQERSGAPELFKQELAGAFERIVRAPKGRRPHAVIDGECFWRVLMPITEHHVYYTVNDHAAEIVVEVLWGARRGREPKL